MFRDKGYYRSPGDYICVLISLAPWSALRIWLYRFLRGYRISRHATIGFGTVLSADDVRIGRATIGRQNVFRGPFSLEIADGAYIGAYNSVGCGRWPTESSYQDAGYLRTCTIGRNAWISDGHYIDPVGGFRLGDDSWIAGRDSQFWTHGAGVEDRSVVIGNNCYIGSAVRFAPGSAIGNHTIVGLGSVVTGKFADDYLMIGGVPAKVIRENYDWKKQQ